MPLELPAKVWKMRNSLIMVIPPPICTQLSIKEGSNLMVSTDDHHIIIRKLSKEEEQLGRENSELPSLIDACYDWTRAHGLTKFTMGDVDVFLSEQGKDLLKETKRILYSKVNARLKTR
jgi:antitoxin component of MazEF toxin-antitoxin module